ncbi:MAG: relaxase/mobilization nuclease domain-containing protein [Oscillospiraceae bacterium]|nr:relaxase/mobilization nuclease domain-containing protein [Oscillospiraceae bacterium]
MATTSIMPLHTGKGRSVARALKDSVDYMENPLKTDGGELISAYECDARTVDNDFMLSKQRYASITGREQERGGVIAYHVRQSFKPGEVTPEEANRIGYELAMRFTKGRFAFIVCTHTDKAHVHSHIIWNSTALDHTRKFRNFIGSTFALRRCSDLICAENGLSVVKDPKPSPGNDYGKWLGDKREPSQKQLLIDTIDAALEQKPETFADFIALMKAAGYEVNDKRKHITFNLPGRKPMRCDTLRGDYTEDAIRERIAGLRVSSSHGRSRASAPEYSSSHRPSLLIDIQAKMQEGKGKGYERWAKLHNLKQMAATLIYLQEKGLDDYDVLRERATAASARFNELSDKIKDLDARLAANAELQKQIVTYSKTRQTYVDYRKAGYSQKFKAEHEADIILHQAAKKYFDGLGYGGGKKLPTIASLRAEYAPTLEEKKQANREYQQAKSEMRELVTARSNVDNLFNAGRNTEREHNRPTL